MKVSNSISSIVESVAFLVVAPTIQSTIQSSINPFHRVPSHIHLPLINTAAESAENQSIRHRQNQNDSEKTYVKINLDD